MKIATSTSTYQGSTISTLAVVTQINEVDHPETLESGFIFKKAKADHHIEILEEIFPSHFQPRWIEYTDPNQPGEAQEMDILLYIALKALQAMVPTGERVTFILSSEDSELRRVAYHSQQLDVYTLDSLQVKRLLSLVEQKFEV